jgi:hypothetical protein
MSKFFYRLIVSAGSIPAYECPVCHQSGTCGDKKTIEHCGNKNEPVPSEEEFRKLPGRTAKGARGSLVFLNSGK